MKNFEKRPLIGKLLISIVFIAGCFISFNNFFLLSKDIIFGDMSGEKLLPQPFPGLYRITKGEKAEKYNAVNRLTIDFAGIYFPAQQFSFLSQNYDTGRFDPWGRPGRYPPFIHYLCSISLCKLDYGYASFFHMLLQILLFYFFFIIAFKMLKIEPDLWFGLWLVNVGLFATPAGLGWLERGQFSLYVAISYLLLILSFLKNKPALVIASALFAYVKWTSFPFLFVIIVVFLLSSKTPKEGVRNAQMALMYLLTILLLSLAFRSKFTHFLYGLYTQELYAQPRGISLALIMPAIIVKGLPFVLIIIGYLYLLKNDKIFDRLIPYFIGAGVLLLTYPTIAFEYNIPSLFCFIPLIFYWTKQPSRASKITRYVFFFFILLISFPNILDQLFGKNAVLEVCLAFSIAFLLIFLIYPGKFSFQTLEEVIT